MGDAFTLVSFPTRPMPAGPLQEWCFQKPSSLNQESLSRADSDNSGQG